MKNILKSKTVWAGLAGIASAGAGYASGEFTTAAAVQTALTGIIGIFLKLAIEKAGIK